MSDNIIRAQALREAAERAVTYDKGVPWGHEDDRETVAAWLYELADEYLHEDEA